MSNPQRSSRRTLVVVVIASLFLWGATGTGVVATNVFGAADRFDRIVDRIRLAVDPPVDREIAAIVEVTELDFPEIEPVSVGAGDVATPSKPKLRRKPVNVKLRAKAGDIFASQHKNDWCSPAGIQMVLAMHKASDNTVGFQRRLAETIKQFESWRDSHNGGWGPAAIAEAIAANGVKGYEVRAYRTRAVALRDSARALSRTKAPVILIAWRGAHTWVMTGYRADADPLVFRNALITGAYIYDPWYPRVSSIWGPSDPPGTFQNRAEMERNYLRWDRPEGNYKSRDGKFLAVVPTIPLKDQQGGRS